MLKKPAWLQHLLELRRRIMRSMMVTLLIWLALLPWMTLLFHYLAYPLLEQLRVIPKAAVPNAPHLVATTLVSPILVPMKFSLFLAVVLSAPWVLHQLWQFVMPALYQSERIRIRRYLISSLMLFYLGLAFAYLVALPLLFAFFIRQTPGYVQLLPDITHYLGFVLQMGLAFAVVFQLPVLMSFLANFGFVSEQSLRGARRYVIVSAFIVGMLLTPPDVLSQLTLALPLCFLFEIGLIFIRLKARATNQHVS